MTPLDASTTVVRLLFVGLLAASCDRNSPPESTNGVPNVLLIVADDLGIADVPGYGPQALPAPSLARLAAEGVVHERAYAVASVCSPARAGLLTARYPQRIGHENNTGDLTRQRREGIGLPLGVPTLATALKARGYTTGLVGKWHLGASEPFHPLERGFDEFFGFLGGGHDYFVWDDPERGRILRGREPVDGEGYLTDALADEAIAFLGRHARDPFFLVFTPNAVHPPLQAPPDLEDGTLVNEAGQAYRAVFMGLDRALGRVLEELDRLELTERTLIAFLGDNGGSEEHGANNGALRSGKRSPYEGGLRIPLIVRFPGGERAGTTVGENVSALDVSATILELSGAELRADLAPDGMDLSGPVPGDRALYWRQGRSRAVLQDDWKLVVRRQLDPELYDLDADPGEASDVAAENPEVVARLEASYAAWDASTVPALWDWRVPGDDD